MKLDNFCQVPGENDHTYNDQDKFSHPDQDRSLTIIDSNYFSKKEIDVDLVDDTNNHSKMQNQDGVIMLKGKSDVLICDIKLNKETMAASKIISEGKQNVPQKKMNLQLINIFPSTLPKEIKPSDASTFEVSNKMVTKKKDLIQQNQKTVKNKHQKGKS